MREEQLMDEIQAPYLEKFQAFWNLLPDQRDIFYTFFTSGLLHWSVRSLSLVPPGVNVVAIGSSLKPEEVEWASNRLGHPFHYINLPVDDKTIWEFLFATSLQNFGWLDVDCLVVEPGLFDEMRRIPTDAMANSIWSYQVAGGYEMQSTFMMFHNAEAIRKVTAEIDVSPCTYSWELNQESRRPPWAFCRVPTPTIADHLASCLPASTDGKPVYLTERSYYDTLQVYQLIAQSHGYRLNHIRKLPSNSVSSEIAHVGRVSYYENGWAGKDLPENRASYAMSLQTDYLVLSEAVDRLPPWYRSRWLEMRSKLTALGLPTEPKAIRKVLEEILDRMGLKESALGSLLRTEV